VASALAELVVVERRLAAQDVVVLDLAARDAGELPAWEPGAHLDIEPPGTGVVRQYSLCGDPADRRRYRIAVLSEATGRGGSAAMHRLRIGAPVAIRAIRNHFALEPADRYVFVAGGIGITPLVPMIGAAAAAGIPWELHYAGRGAASMAFASELAGEHPEGVTLYPKAEGAALDLAGVSARQPGAAMYCCGPARMLQAAEALAGPTEVHLERFVADATAEVDRDGDEPFDVHFAQSGITVRVAPGESILAVGEAAGADVFGSCLEGICGTCETRVIEGIPDHRDSVLNSADTGTMMICVSRAACRRLTLDA
jgi:ferredoxin-NADP reductase